MRTNKHIYNSIMKDVSKIVKQHINEAEDAKTDVEVAADKLISDLKKSNNALSLDMAVGLMKIISKGNEKKVFYQNVSYDKLIPELEKRLKEKLVNDSFRK